jgi:Cu/Zn superoxide dismutase
MRKLWLAIGIMVLAGLLATGAAACDDEEGGGDEEATATAPSETPAGSPTTSASGEAVEVTLAEQGGSGVTGSATLTPNGSATDVAVTVDGLEQGTYLLHVHVGACEQPGEFVEALPDLAPDADGAAEGAGSASQALDTLTDGQHYLVVFEGDTPLSCGNIEAAS